MSMDEEAMREAVGESFRLKDVETAPGFNETWLAAEARYLASKRRRLALTGIAASVTLFALVMFMVPAGEEPELPDFELLAQLMNSTQWRAPSDVLMPEHTIDIYQELPQIPASTDLYEGALL